MTKRIIIALVTILTITGEALAQKGKETGFHGGIGIHGGIGEVLVVPHATKSVGPTGGINFDATYYFTESFGVMAGIGGSYIESKITGEDLKSTPVMWTKIRTATGMTDIKSRYLINTPDVEERYSMMYVEVPIMAVLQGNPLDFTIKSFHKCYVGIGARIALPISFKAESEYSVSSISLGPDVIGTGVELDEPMAMETYTPEMLSYDVKEVAKNNESSLLYVMATMEAGATFKFNNGGSFSIGLYGNYAINHTTINNDKEAYLISSDGRNATTVGYMNSNRVSMFKYFTAGVKLQYNLF